RRMPAARNTLEGSEFRGQAAILPAEVSAPAQPAPDRMLIEANQLTPTGSFLSASTTTARGRSLQAYQAASSVSVQTPLPASAPADSEPHTAGSAERAPSQGSARAT